MSKQNMDAINSDDDSDHDFISTEMFEDIRDRSQYHPNINRREAHYKIRDLIKQRIGMKKKIKATQNMGKSLHKLFMTVVK